PAVDDAVSVVVAVEVDDVVADQVHRAVEQPKALVVERLDARPARPVAAVVDIVGEEHGQAVDILAVDRDRVALGQLTDLVACRAAVDEVVNDYGRVHTLVNMAQKWSKLTLLEVTDAEMTTVWETGPAATLRMMQLCHPHMKTAGGGAIVNCGSAAGTQGGVH